MVTNTEKPKKSNNKIPGNANQTNPANATTYNGPLLTQTGTNHNNQTSFGGMTAQARPPVSIGANGQMVIGQAGNTANTGANHTGNTQNPQQTQNGLSGVSSTTQANMNQYATGYQPGANITAAQAQLNQILGEQPGNYVGRYDDQIQGLIGGLTDGSRKFDYNFNDDELFKYYADLYTQQGRQASQDVMGQAAALTGGYGNSYAESAGNQAYQQYLGQLYDRGMELRDRAYQQYQDERQDEYNRLNMLQQADELGYGRYRDTLGDWRNDRDYYTGRLDKMSEQDWQRWMADRDYWTQMAQMENSDYWTGQNFWQQGQQFAEQMGLNWAQLNQDQQQFLASQAQQQAQFDANMAMQQQANAWDYVQAILANGHMPSAELLAMVGLSAQDAQNMMAAAAGGGGGGGGSGSTNNNNNNQETQPTWLTNMFVNGVNNAGATLNNGINSIGWFNFLDHLVHGNNPTSQAVGSNGSKSK